MHSPICSAYKMLKSHRMLKRTDRMYIESVYWFYMVRYLFCRSWSSCETIGILERHCYIIYIILHIYEMAMHISGLSIITNSRIVASRRRRRHRYNNHSSVSLRVRTHKLELNTKAKRMYIKRKTTVNIYTS